MSLMINYNRLYLPNGCASKLYDATVVTRARFLSVAQQGFRQWDKTWRIPRWLYTDVLKIGTFSNTFFSNIYSILNTFINIYCASKCVWNVIIFAEGVDKCDHWKLFDTLYDAPGADFNMSMAAFVTWAINLNESGTNWLTFCRQHFQMHFFLNENRLILIHIAPKFVPSGPINYKLTLVQMMVWYRTDDRPITHPILTKFSNAIRHHFGSMW